MNLGGVELLYLFGKFMPNICHFEEKEKVISNVPLISCGHPQKSCINNIAMTTYNLSAEGLVDSPAFLDQVNRQHFFSGLAK